MTMQAIPEETTPVETPNWRAAPFSDREKLMLAVIGVMGLIIAGMFVFGDGYGIFRTGERHGYITNIFTEGLGIFVTVVALGYYQTQRARENLKQELVRGVTKRSNSTVLDAIDDLRHYGWLTGEKGLLRGERLHNAQMQGADLRSANLCEANLWGAKLDNAVLIGANFTAAKLYEADLPGANLRQANFTNANLRDVDLRNTNLREANLTGAHLVGADLSGAQLGYANLTGANLRGAKFDKAKLNRTTTLPDGKIYTRKRWEALLKELSGEGEVGLHSDSQ